MKSIAAFTSGTRAAAWDGPAPASRPDDPHERAAGVVTSGPDAFGEFYRQEWPGIARALALTLGDVDLAAEAADEAMVRAYQRWATVRSYENAAGWVYRVGLNWARSYRRRLGRFIPFTQHDAGSFDDIGDPGVRDALLRLDVKHRSVVVCRLLLDWSVEQTADALGIAPGTVKSRLHRALQALEPDLDLER